MKLALLPDAAPGFDDPLELLRACHERISARCRTLRKLQAHLPLHGCDTQAKQAAESVLRYFESAARHHHEDEEHDLFPMLRACADPEIDILLTRLVAEHRTLENHWLALQPQLQALTTGDNAAPAAADAFIAAYERHIELENGQLLPLAALHLNPAQLTKLGQSMAARRQIS